MDCRLFERQMQLNIDGLLSAKEREDMLRHAQACPSCAALLQDMTQLSALLSRRLRAVDPPAGFAQAVMAALPPLPAKQTVRRRPVWRRWGTIAAAAALILAAGLYSLWDSGPAEKNLLTQPNTNIIAEKDITHPTDTPIVTPEPDKPLLAEEPQDIAANSGLEEQPLEQADDDIPPTVDNPVAIKDPQPELIEDDDVGEPYETDLDLPQPALDPPQPGGMFSLTVLAAYEDCDAILPAFGEDNTVEFYTKYKNKIYLWRQALGAEKEPEYQEQPPLMPTVTAIMANADESAQAGFSTVIALSPDGRYKAVNRGGEEPGLWLYVNSAPVEGVTLEQPEVGVKIAAEGGGKVLSWSPDSNKLLFSDKDGKLYAYYSYAEQHILPLFSGIVSCASWSDNSSMVVFSGKMEKKAFSSIYTIIVP